MPNYEVVTTVTTIEGAKPQVGKFEKDLSKFSTIQVVQQLANVCENTVAHAYVESGGRFAVSFCGFLCVMTCENNGFCQHYKS